MAQVRLFVAVRRVFGNQGSWPCLQVRLSCANSSRQSLFLAHACMANTSPSLCTLSDTISSSSSPSGEATAPSEEKPAKARRVLTTSVFWLSVCAYTAQLLTMNVCTCLAQAFKRLRKAAVDDTAGAEKIIPGAAQQPALAASPATRPTNGSGRASNTPLVDEIAEQRVPAATTAAVDISEAMADEAEADEEGGSEPEIDEEEADKKRAAVKKGKGAPRNTAKKAAGGTMAGVGEKSHAAALEFTRYDPIKAADGLWKVRDATSVSHSGKPLSCTDSLLVHRLARLCRSCFWRAPSRLAARRRSV